MKLQTKALVPRVVLIVVLEYNLAVASKTDHDNVVSSKEYRIEIVCKM
jgi:hypothetical protein